MTTDFEREYIKSIHDQIQHERTHASTVRIEVRARNGLSLYRGAALLEDVEQQAGQLLRQRHITVKRHLPAMKGGGGFRDLVALFTDFIQHHQVLLGLLRKLPSLVRQGKSALRRLQLAYYALRYPAPKSELTPIIDLVLHCTVKDNSQDRELSRLTVKRALYELIALTPILDAHLKQVWPELNFNYSYNCHAAKNHVNIAVFSYIDDQKAVKKLKHVIYKLGDSSNDILIRFTKTKFQYFRCKIFDNEIVF